MLKINEIYSTSNDKIKLLKKLDQKKYREENSQFIVENFKTIYDSMKSDAGIEALFVTKEFVLKNQDKFDELLDNTKLNEYFLINERVNNYFSSLENSSGICALYNIKNKAVDSNSIIVYLNGINDPGNLGTIFRSALAFDIKNIILDDTCVDIYNPKTISSAKDSIFKLNISFDSGRKVLGEIKKKMKVYSTRLEDSKDISILKKQDKFCLVFGSEANGISQDIYEISDDFIKINTSSNIESLNVASSCAIIFHYIYNNSK